MFSYLSYTHSRVTGFNMSLQMIAFLERLLAMVAREGPLVLVHSLYVSSVQHHLHTNEEHDIQETQLLDIIKFRRCSFLSCC